MRLTSGRRNDWASGISRSENLVMERMKLGDVLPDSDGGKGVGLEMIQIFETRLARAISQAARRNVKKGW
jgi:hypothetical protein